MIISYGTGLSGVTTDIPIAYNSTYYVTVSHNNADYICTVNDETLTNFIINTRHIGTYGYASNVKIYYHLIGY